MNIKSFIKFMRKKIPNDYQLCRAVGIQPDSLHGWEKRTTPLSNSDIYKMFSLSQKYSIIPIIEYYPIEYDDDEDILILDDDSGQKNHGLYETLKSVCGVYIFYDSRGQALYVGKTEKNNLWDEMKSAFHRDRGKRQTIFRAEHKYPDDVFMPETDGTQQIKPKSLTLLELAEYFSAYQISEPLIHNVEALLIRAFSNSILNRRVETFKEIIWPDSED